MPWIQQPRAAKAARSPSWCSQSEALGGHSGQGPFCNFEKTLTAWTLPEATNLSKVPSTKARFASMFLAANHTKPQSSIRV